MPYPLMFRLGQRLHHRAVDDIPAAVEAALAKLRLGTRVKPGDKVAITCGSRRIANYSAIIKAVVDHFKRLHANPFLVPAMAWHGTLTGEGRREVLRSLGITEEVVGVEISSAVEHEIIGQLPEGLSVYCDRQVLRADHTVVVNRVSLHSVFHGDVQAGLLEMVAMGLGKLDGAEFFHPPVENGFFEDIARGVHKIMLKKGNLLAGLMIVENGGHATTRIEAALPEDFIAKEKPLLHYARGLAPRLPFKFVDILQVDEIGTPFNCLGADANVIGRKGSADANADTDPQVRALIYRDLNPESHGNAIGVGQADFVRTRLLRKMDAKATKLTALTYGIPRLAAAPIDFETDRGTLDAALALTGSGLPEKVRIVWIRNTLSIVEFECSEVYLREVKHWNDLSILSDLHPLDFDSHGNLRDFVTDDSSESSKKEDQP